MRVFLIFTFIERIDKLVIDRDFLERGIFLF